MQELVLQNIAEDISFDNLPAVWRNFDLERFSKEKTLYDFQQKALENALKILWRYYKERFNYQEREKPGVNQERKKYLFEFYQSSSLFPKKGVNYNLEKKEEKKSTKLLEEFYSVVDNEISFESFINRMAFWMATGSGKTLVIIKLIEILGKLIQAKEIPQNDILYLTCRDDLIKQFKTFVNEFNFSYQNEIRINLESLKNYARVKRNLSVFANSGKEITIFYYRSDNLSNKRGDKIIDFRTIENQGKWYVLLDEAHKGDSDDSKRKAIYSILSRNGFLFNFSATFVDQRDFLTTAYNFNLEKFIKEGYGKHIYLSEQEIKAFKDKTAFSKIEKQKIVLKSLILLTYIKKFAHKVKKVKKSLYHYPLLLTLVNSVNQKKIGKEPDLELFFREIEKIGQGEVSQEVFQKAKEEILEEFGKENKFQFEETGFEINKDVISKIEYQDVLEEVFNSKNSGGIEVLKIPGNRKELIFKLKKSEKPFALIKIGDISNWLRNQLEGYEINESFDNKSIFDEINRDDSEINILMGSRTFYEGWDSNRPNIILFINIGVGTKAKKFVLQSTGRGIRIEPEKNKRKRISHLFNAYPKKVDGTIYHKIRKFVLPLETLFIFGTKPKNLEEIVKTFEIEKGSGQNIGEKYIKENPEVKKRLLLVPTYKLSTRILAEEEEPAKFSIYPDDFNLTKNYFDYLEDDRVRLMYYDNDIRTFNKEVQTLKVVKTSIQSEKEKYYLDNSVSQVFNPDFVLSQIFRHFSLVPEKFDRFDKVAGKIVHFEKIEFRPEEGKELKELLRKIEKVSQYKKEEKRIKQLKISFKDKEELLNSRKEQSFDGIKIEYIPNHYYYPVILRDRGEKITYLNHIIKENSEVKFLEKLEEYLDKESNLFHQFKWWLFSKIDQTTDNVFIPWYNPKTNSIEHYHPDFVFWGKEKEDNNYYIVFIDPHGIEHTEYERKIEGYKKIFEEKNKIKTFSGKQYGLNNDLKVKTFLFFITDRNYLPSGDYKRYWFHNSDIEKIINKIREEDT